MCIRDSCRARLDLRAIAKAGSNGASEFMTNISMSIVNMLYNWQLMRLMGSDGVAVFGVIMYVNFIFVSIFLGYSMGSAPLSLIHIYSLPPDSGRRAAAL